MIEVSNVSKVFGSDFILKDINFVINEGDKVGIVGRNGMGKSTLLKCMIFEEYLTSGTVKINGSIGYIDQSKLLDEEKNLFTQYLEIFPELFRIHNFLQQEEKNIHNNYIEEYIKKEAKFNEEGGYDFKIKVDKLLTGFGFLKEDIYRKVSSFSGGEKTKLSLIKLLLLEPDYLFLDEPTNHLDLNAIIWLEKYLKSLKKTLIIVSHDEMFLENVCNKIMLVEQKKVKVFKTTYSNYLKQRELDYEHDLNNYENQIAVLKKYEDFIIKNRGKPTKIGQVNDRKAKIEKIKLLEKPLKFNNKISFDFKGYHLKKSTYIDLFDVEIGYENKILLQNINLKIYGGEKIAIIGKNGIGKSTFFQALLDKKARNGKIKIPSVIKIGYFDQEQKKIERNKTLYDLIYDTNEFESQSAIRKYLGKFLFKNEDVFKKFYLLSGGEKIRVVLAIMSLQKYDILLLDEPTNHLDIDTKNILMDTLKKFPGTLLFITHDRKLIQEVANKILYFKEDGVEEFTGNWNEYINEINIINNQKKKNIQKDIEPIRDEKDKNKKVNVQKLEKLEKEIEQLEKLESELVEKLRDKENLRDYKLVDSITTEMQDIVCKIDNLYKEYNNTLG